MCSNTSVTDWEPLFGVVDALSALSLDVYENQSSTGLDLADALPRAARMKRLTVYLLNTADLDEGIWDGVRNRAEDAGVVDVHLSLPGAY